MQYIKSFFRLILWRLWILKAKRVYKEMIKSDSEQVKAMGHIIGNTIRQEFNTIEEKLWIKNLYELRRGLKDNPQEIMVTDYGAGTGESDRSEEEMQTGIVTTSTIGDIHKASKPLFWTILMFNIVREFKPKLILELGTCLGVSAAYQGAAQVLNYNNGKLLTMEGAASLVEQSKSNLQSLGLINVEVIQGRFADNLERILNENKPIDYVFIDGHHDRIATIRYFEQILPYLSEKAIIIFDDISWSEGMKDAWNKIINHKCINLIVDMKTIGICFIDTKQEAKRIYNIR